MTSCTCDFGTICGPAMMAAGFLSRIQERETGKKSRSDDGTTRNVLDILSGRLKGSGPVLFDFAHWADELNVTVARLREVVTWLVGHQFLALEGDVNGVARLWVNPSVAFSPWTDPRITAARYRFPYIMTAEGGMTAEQPVIVHPYDAAGWNEVYQQSLSLIHDPVCFSSGGCSVHDS
ncbi:hypothetical protein [Streptomyces sp. G-G2]|uniref:hypothetical protein n=1 Tax=Streptomyces sp. G-G2 TaxID=3046201 RepID=UPI0024B99038|nr:hypothetical protein [Streptomyces sp. G-G2]MDJ0386078.1 hypothetical protein [Streptomyces sp. G-G2]